MDYLHIKIGRKIPLYRLIHKLYKFLNVEWISVISTAASQQDPYNYKARGVEVINASWSCVPGPLDV